MPESQTSGVENYNLFLALSYLLCNYIYTMKRKYSNAVRDVKRGMTRLKAAQKNGVDRNKLAAILETMGMPGKAGRPRK